MLNKSLIDTWSFFKNHIVALSLIILPIVAPVEILTTLYHSFFTSASDEFNLAQQLIPMTVGFIAYPIYAAGVVFYIASVISGERIDTMTSWSLAASNWLPYVIMSLFIGFAVALGIILLIIPGIVFAVRFSFSEFDLLLNKSKPIDAMQNSWDLTKEYMWVLLGGFVIITILIYGPYFILVSFNDKLIGENQLLDTLFLIAYSVLGVLYKIFAFRVYEFAKMQHSANRSY